jgi:ribonucleoside-diphosphate reductase alpha chain
MTVVIKDKGKRRKEFDKDRLGTFIRRGIKDTYSLDVGKFIEKCVRTISQRSEIAATEITALLTLNALEMVGEATNANEKINLNNLDWRFFARYILQMELYKRASKNRAYDAAEKYGDYYGNLKVLVDKGLYDPMLLVKYTKEELKSIGGLVDPAKDELFDYAGLRALSDRYLVKDYDGSIFELPQERWLTISLALMQDEDRAKRTYYVMEMYHALSNLYLTVATPTLANAGRPNGQLSSCFILSSSDSLRGIYDDNTDVATLSKNGGGINKNSPLAA